MNKINVIGLGYIGLPTALALAAHDIPVVGSDYNENLVRTLNNGKTTFKEDGLDDLFQRAIEKKIEFKNNYIETDTYIVSVPTPYMSKDKKIDPSYVVNAVTKIMDVCLPETTIIIESTVSPGTIDKYIRPVIISEKSIHLVHAPERILPGNMIYELQNNSRTIGADELKVGEKVKQLYASFCNADITVTDIRTAEMTKVVENTYRDINIAFANELAKICRADKMDVYEIIKIANKHPRVNILKPGPGVGGHCISVDPWFLVGDYPGLANIILAARKINDSMPEFVMERISEIMDENGISNLGNVGVYGLTYKENVDDIRESPSLQMLDCMHRHLAKGIKVYDPFVEADIVPNQYHSLDDFLSAVDMVVIMVSHQEIIDNMYKLNDKIILDTPNICKFDNCYKL